MAHLWVDDDAADVVQVRTKRDAARATDDGRQHREGATSLRRVAQYHLAPDFGFDEVSD